jgi:glycosyltransferase involved in cell wall biosynthesis
MFGIADRVHFMGHVDDLRAVWADNDLLVLSSFGEGIPLTLVEAMLCGRPAVVTDVGGNTEWLEDGTTGFVAPAATPQSVAAALERAWAARPQWRQMGERARDAALARYDPRPGRTLLGLLEQVARERSTPGR